jgi:uncharacterized protein (TIGR03437 family)
MPGLSRYALALPVALALWADSPFYSAASIVNTANGSATLAPFTYISIIGTNLSYETSVRAATDEFGVHGVKVNVNGQLAVVSFISPTLVVFLFPQNIAGPGRATLQLTRQGAAGPIIRLDILDCAPTLFQFDPATAIAAHHLDWTVVTLDKPAHAGELVVLYATGLGPYKNMVDFPMPPFTAQAIVRRAQFQVLLDGQPVDDHLVEYAGVAPGLLGVYQINLELPANVGKDPEIRIKLGDRISPPGLRLPLK